LNGHEFPNRYAIKDLKIIIPGLLDHLNNEKYSQQFDLAKT